MKNTNMFENIASIDAYGSKIELQFKHRKKHPTVFGGFITLANVGLLIFVIILYGSQLFNKSKPSIVFSEETVKSPEMYNMTESTFSIAFGMQNPDFNHYIDETIYSIKVFEQVMIKQLNQTTNNYDPTLQFLDLNAHPCKLENIKVPGTYEFYHDLAGFSQMYCFEQQDNKAWIAGDFISDVFGAILVQVSQCTNKTEEQKQELISKGQNIIVCKSQEQIDKLLSKSYFAAYYTDKVINPKELNNPFQTITRDIFWPVSNKLVKELTMNFRNVYIESDVGLTKEDIEIKRDVVFSYYTESVIYGLNSQFINLVLRYEKFKQSRYFRSYVKIEDVLAQISGVMDFIVIISSFICLKVSQLDLSKSLANEIFSFYEEDNKQQQTEENKDIKKDVENKVIRKFTESLNKSKQLQLFHKQNQINEESNNKLEDHNTSFNRNSSLQNKKKQHNEILSKFIKSYKKTLSNHTQKNEKEQKQYQKSISKLFQVSNYTLSLKVVDYIMYYICPCSNRIARKKQQIDYSQKLLDKHLDAMYLVNKLQEIDKLKMLLLSEDQIKLFNYLPKPSIKIVDVINDKKKNKQDQKLNNDQERQTDSMCNQSIKTTTQNKYSYLEKFNMLYLDERSDIEKASDAYSAFEKMRKLHNRTQIDTKLLLMLDPKILDFFLEEGEVYLFHDNVRYEEEQQLPSLSRGGLLKNKLDSQFKRIQTQNLDEMDFQSQNSPFQNKNFQNYDIQSDSHSISTLFKQTSQVTPKDVSPISVNTTKKMQNIFEIQNKVKEVNEQQSVIKEQQNVMDSCIKQQNLFTLDNQITLNQIENVDSSFLSSSQQVSPKTQIEHVKISFGCKMIPTSLKKQQQ